jgi:glycosyltransferase involved in cell wall biosynthesis
VRILLWHVHGAWTTAFVHGGHDHVVPVLPDRGPDGRGRAQTYAWPDRVTEMAPEELREADFDVVVLQRPHELEHLAEEWLGGRRPGRDLPAIYVEHNAPQGRIAEMRHPAADRPDLTLVHVTHFNALFWDAGSTPSRVVDVFGMDAASLGGIEDLPQDELHTEMARRRLYLHPIRWTSLGLSLLEAMHLAMPVVALGTTEAFEAVPAEAGVVSTDVDRLAEGIRRLMADEDEARERGEAARAAALRRYGLGRFLADWDDLLQEVAG